MKPWHRRVLGFLAAALTATLLATTASTQSVLASLGGLGVEVPLSVRFEATVHDWLGMGPLYGALITAGFLVALLTAGVIVRFAPATRGWLYPLAGAVAVATILIAMKSVFEISTIAGARTLAGLAMQMLAGAAGGWVFGRVTRRNIDGT
ncbi:MAG: hypothetical protein AAGE01_03080 [Pseudomonadota bacterium]